MTGKITTITVPATSVEADSEPEAVEVHVYAVFLTTNQAVNCIDTRKLVEIKLASPVGFWQFNGDPEVSLGQGIFAVDKVAGIVEMVTQEYMADLSADDEDEDEEVPQIVTPSHGNSSKKKKWRD